MNNRWNKIIYQIWSPIYDRFFNSGIFLKARKQLFHRIPFNDKDKILFVGVGTGADLEIINHEELDITAIDDSPHMFEKARKKFPHSSIKFIEMDAQHLQFNNESFDYVVASLILSVVPNPDQCFREMTRVLKQDGMLIIFDKFVPKNQKLSFRKRLLRPFIRLLGTDIGLTFEPFISNHKDLFVEEDTPIMLNGMYRKIIIRKRG